MSSLFDNEEDAKTKSTVEVKKRKKKGASADFSAEENATTQEEKPLPRGYEIKAAGKTFLVETKLAPFVYTVKRKNSSVMYCLKVQPRTAASQMKQLHRDLLILQEAAKHDDCREHFLQLIAKDHNDSYNFLVMTLAEDSIADLRANDYQNGELPKTVAGRLCIDTFQAVHDLHCIGFLHNNIQPSKFVLSSKPGTLFVIGFSLSYILSDKDRLPRDVRRPLPRLSDSMFRARSYHKGEGLHAKDDIESWLYLCFDLFGQRLLPWNNELDDRNMYSNKEMFFLEAYPDAVAKAPKQLLAILRSVGRLRGPDRPDYLFIGMQLLRMKHELGFNAKGPYEWQIEKDDDTSIKATTARSETPKAGKKAKKMTASGSRGQNSIAEYKSAEGCSDSDK